MTGKAGHGMLPSTPFITGKVRWQVAAEHRDLLLGPHGLRLEEWAQSGQVQTVKQGPHRAVYHVILNGLSFFVKHNRVSNLRAWLRQLVRPSKARTEYQHALAIAARGVPTFVPLGVGETRASVGPGDSYLITRSLDGTEPVGSFIEKTLPTLPPLRQAGVRQRLARALGQLVAQMHATGIAHHDFHAGNVLVRLTGGDEIALFLIDLHALRVGRPLNWRAARANLVMLNRWFVLRASRTDRLRCWHAYYRTRAESDPRAFPGGLSWLNLAHELEKRTWASNLRFWHSRDRRCLLNNRYYRQVRSDVARGHVVTDLDTQTRALLLADPDAPFRQPNLQLLKNSRSSTVAEFDIRLGGALRRVVYKRFRVRTWSEPWLALFRRTPALRSWVQGHGLRERCLPTARPLAVVHRRRGGLSHEGYLLTEKIDQGRDLHSYLARLAALPAAERRMRLHALIQQVGRMARELHRRRLSHRDLKAANILVSEDPEKRPTCWLIDLVGLERYRNLPRARRVQNLARLNASFHQSAHLTRTDRMRILRVYLAWGLRGREGWKRWWHDIEQATLAKIARNLRKGRPLC
jgi:tRNA A-37 threonylcarbamoyl transferase component Bud32